ncbi:hypothetical protein QLG13_10325 [Rhodococcus aetherivorans]|uniref:Uncharacterized protein n=2 Tax=Rhodococcus TaxID=1827 RepID=A0A098BV11_9NOCA|nr:hypothetical protein [Rhodococcus aetherivorans]CDZ92564.1 hypothetical protein RHRU231_960093 [Rhodococcus ruber]
MTDAPPPEELSTAIAAIRRMAPEGVQEHWVDVGGVRYPPKQVWGILSGRPRSGYNTHHALSQLGKIGFETSVNRPHGAQQNELDSAETSVDTSTAASGTDSEANDGNDGGTGMTTPGTWRISDGSRVAFADARAAWAVAAQGILERTARRYNGFITYMDLAEQVQEEAGIRTRIQMRNWIGKVLGVVVDECARRGEPPLTALCVKQDHTVGDGYRYVLETASEPIPDDLDHHAAWARLECYRAYADNLPADGGEPTLTPKVAATRSAAARRDASTRHTQTDFCPVHRTALPATGRCDYCD